MTDWEYYVAYNPPRTSPEDPITVYRHPKGAANYARKDEIFGRGGIWRSSDRRLRSWLGMEDWELQPCTRARAAAVVRGMVERGTVAQMPDDLVD